MHIGNACLEMILLPSISSMLKSSQFYQHNAVVYSNVVVMKLMFHCQRILSITKWHLKHVQIKKMHPCPAVDEAHQLLLGSFENKCMFVTVNKTKKCSVEKLPTSIFHKKYIKTGVLKPATEFRIVRKRISNFGWDWDIFEHWTTVHGCKNTVIKLILRYDYDTLI